MLKAKKRLSAIVLLLPCTFVLLSHFLSHEEQKVYICFVYPAEKSTELAKRPRISTGTAPSRGRRLRFRKSCRRLFTVIEECVNGNFQCSRHLFQSFNGGNGVAVFYPGDVAAPQTSTFFNVALRHIFLFPQSLQPVSNDQSRILQSTGIRRVRFLP
jgi:hypothetical protein